MTSAAELLGEQLARQRRPHSREVSATVLDVTDSGRVNLMLLGALVPDVPCTDSYRDRQAGDVVLVRVGARPVVLYRLGDDPAEEDETRIGQLAADAAQDLIAVSAYTWGTGAPAGPGWQTVTQLYTRKDANGVGQLYAQIAGADTSPPETPGRPPKSVVVSPTNSGSWRGGRPDEYASSPTQGDWTGRGNRRGAWFYGTAIASACSGKTVSSMQVTFTRKRGAGRNNKVAMHLYLHDHTSAPSGQLVLGSGPEELLRLSVGAKGRATLPASWRTALAAGTVRGLAIYASGRSDYAAFTGGSIKISFSAS
ncbi:hypothetical protein [Streptomyces fructofermentans]|uniref:Uncharacterized protein n=1 Tax=Streptomyces fructofermentans TaxID=152141 RepID=A0A918NVF2_9ACTN|nr:hypothetical protein [Streptomyces fructofermentans]GGX98604.1 hypothetical protein GCM10010515_76040 [Streptomyces fructofermentans]